MNTDEFELEGIKVKVSAPPEKELRKIGVGHGYAIDCDCGTSKVKLTENDIRAGEGNMTFEQVVGARKRAEILVKAPNDFVPWCREVQRADHVAPDVIDLFETPIQKSCPVCQRRHIFNVRFENPVKFEQLTVLEAIKKKPLELNTFTRKASARLAQAQGFVTPEKFVEEVNGLLADLKAVDLLRDALDDVAAKIDLKSGLGKSLINMLRDDIKDIPNTAKGIERELTDRAQQIFDASWVQFEEDEGEKGEGLLQKIQNKLKGQEAVLLVAEKEEPRK